MPKEKKLFQMAVSSRNNSGFTLVEILLYISFYGLVMALLIPCAEGIIKVDNRLEMEGFCQRLAAEVTAAVAVAEATDVPGHIVQESTTQLLLQPGVYLIAYHFAANLLTAGYLQITPGYGGRGHLEYGVYNRTGIDNTSVSGSASFIISVEEATRFSLNSNSSVTVRDGEATLVILALQPSREA